jgi:microfibrillar-associated protein 1
LDTQEDEDEIATRRARIRARLRQQQQEEEEEEEEEEEFGRVAVPSESFRTGRDEYEEPWPEPGAESSEEASEYETDTDESEDEVQLSKPVFVPKSKRATIAELDMRKEHEEQREQMREAAAERRKIETRNLVADQVRREEAEGETTATGNDSEDGMPSDIDDLDDPLEYEARRLRELRRLKRDVDEREAFEKERLETERRRNMTDAERAEEDKRLGKGEPKEKAKMNFLQKYYHKGAFYMDETEMEAQDVRKREYMEPTLEDKFDKEALPKVLQVKKFGFAGRTKYTHLADQDTTDRSSPWGTAAAAVVHERKMAGMGDIDSAARKRPKNS